MSSDVNREEIGISTLSTEEGVIYVFEKAMV